MVDLREQANLQCACKCLTVIKVQISNLHSANSYTGYLVFSPADFVNLLT